MNSTILDNNVPVHLCQNKWRPIIPTQHEVIKIETIERNFRKFSVWWISHETVSWYRTAVQCADNIAKDNALSLLVLDFSKGL